MKYKLDTKQKFKKIKNSKKNLQQKIIDIKLVKGKDIQVNVNPKKIIRDYIYNFENIMEKYI